MQHFMIKFGSETSEHLWDSLVTLAIETEVFPNP